MSNGVAIAFFEIEGFHGTFDGDAPWFARHLAMNVDSMKELLAYKQRLDDAGIDVIGVTDHEGIWQSIYLFDPNGIRLELTYQVRPLSQQDAADAEVAVQKWIAEHAGREQQSAHAGARTAGDPDAGLVRAGGHLLGRGPGARQALGDHRPAAGRPARACRGPHPPDVELHGPLRLGAAGPARGRRGRDGDPLHGQRHRADHGNCVLDVGAQRRPGTRRT